MARITKESIIKSLTQDAGELMGRMPLIKSPDRWAFGPDREIRDIADIVNFVEE